MQLFKYLLQRREPSMPPLGFQQGVSDCLHVELRLAIQYPAKGGCSREGYLAGARVCWLGVYV